MTATKHKRKSNKAGRGTCQSCGVVFEYTHKRRFCTDQCKREVKNRQRRSKRHSGKGKCSGCGIEFEFQHKRQFCTDECRVKNWRQLVKDEQRRKDECTCGKAKDKNASMCFECLNQKVFSKNCKCGKVFNTSKPYLFRKTDCDWCLNKIKRTKSDAKRREATSVGNVDFQLIVKRCKGICQRCGVKTTSGNSKERTHRTLDHIIPLSLGGTHTEENCTLLCRICNSIKSSKIVYSDIVTKRIVISALTVTSKGVQAFF